MKTAFWLLLPLYIVGLVSCQKEATDPNMQPPTEGPAPSTNTYMPLTKGSFWKYRDSATGTFLTQTVLGGTKVIDGKIFTTVLGQNSTQADTAYMTQLGHDYYNFANISSVDGSFLFHYLNDTAAVGRSWEYAAGQANGIPAYFKTSIVERGISRTVSGKTFTDVIHTRMEMWYDLLGERLDVGFYEYYTAKNTGIIQVQSRLKVMDGVFFSSSSDLVEYSIK